MKTSLSRSLLLVAWAATSAAIAQTVTPPPLDAASMKYDVNKNGILEPEEQAAKNSDAIMLSPFEVRTDQDRGYQAINAGSGGRIDMEMRLTPSAMSVLTKEFLEDWNVTTMQESFRYAMNVDNGGFNPSGGGLTDFEFNFRGVGSSGNYPTRNYFLYYGNADSYNVERLEFSRGPNSVLFGDGQIGGVATTATKVPRLDRNAYTAAVRFDSWGGMRSTIDANHLVDSMTAVRINGLYQQNTFGTAWRDNSDGYDSAIDVAIAHAFTPRTKLRGEVEFLRYVRMSMSQTYADQMAYYTPGYIFDRTAPNLPASQALAGVTAVSTNAE
ncbi:MAG: TonB-dependent receptor, partial [Opitutaceae bacterium]